MAAPPRFVARIAPARLLLLTALSLGFVALSLYMLGYLDGEPKPPFPWAGWVGLAFFGPAALILARRAFDREPQIVIDASGVYAKQWSSRTVPWHEIAGVETAEVNRQRFLCLTIADPSRYPPESALGHLMRANRAMGFGDLAISTIGTDRKHDELVAAIARYRPVAYG